ncbi:MAG: hypothetical protein J6W51_00455 [Fibrobacter sp.]|nr:hypothetical protein [Fibrobacter sp.]
MVANKIAKLSATVAMLGLGILAACSDDNVASSFSETQTGKPVEQLGPLAELDTSLVRKYVNEGDLGCGSLAKSAAEEDSVADTSDTFVIVRRMCGSHKDIYLYINARAQVVDVDGKPVAGATVYEEHCSFEDKSCQHVTDSEGYFYLDSVNFLTYLENLAKNNPKYSYIPEFQSIQLRVLSADSSLGANVFLSFASAHVVGIDGKLYAELKQIVLEPVYTVKLYLDSLFAVIDETTPESEIPYDERWNKEIRENIGGEGEGICLWLQDEGSLSSSYYYYEEEGGFPSYYYPCQKVTEEDYENGYVVLFGLPEGKYQLDIWNVGSALPSVEVKKP